MLKGFKNAAELDFSLEENKKKMEEAFPDVDIEMQAGNQPIYYYIVSAE